MTPVCRLCLGEESLEDIFQCDDLHIWISDFLSIVVSKDDTISQSVCVGCRMRLNEFQEFQLRCFEVQDVLLGESIAMNENKNVISVKTNEAKKSRIDELLSNGDQREKESLVVGSKSIPKTELDLESDLFEAEPTKVEPESDDERDEIVNELRHKGAQNKSVEVFECNICHKMLKNNRSLSWHIRTIHREKKFECIYCPLKFAVQTRLNGHMREVHKHEKNYICSTCSKTFFAKHDWNIHMRLNSCRQRKGNDVSALECDICNKKLKSNNSLNWHKRTVHGEKTLKCTFCSLKFAAQNRLNTHMRQVHERVKNHPCPVCGMRFFARRDLARHATRCDIEGTVSRSSGQSASIEKDSTKAEIAAVKSEKS